MRTLVFRVWVVVFLFMIGNSGCKKEDESGIYFGVDISGAGISEILKFEVNDGDAQFLGDTLVIVGYQSDNAWVYMRVVDTTGNEITGGNYSLSTTNVTSYASHQYVVGGFDKIFGVPVGADSARMIIHSIDQVNKKIDGEFYFTCVDADGNSRKLENGIFRIK